MQVTGANTDDADALAELWVELAAGQRAHGSHLRPEANRTRIREAIVQYIASDRLLVARGDEVVGFVMFDTETVRYDQDVSRGIVENLYVDSGYRREGIGSELLAAAENRLEEQGVDVVTLEAMAPNDDARRFYRSHGYDPHRVELEKRLDES